MYMNTNFSEEHLLYEELTSISMASAYEGWAVGRIQCIKDNEAYEAGIIRRYKGDRWLPEALPTNMDPHAICMLSNTEGWAVGHSGSIIKYNEGIWSSINSPTSITLNGVAMLSSSEGWAVGSEGFEDKATSVILHYYDNQWTVWGTYYRSNLYDIQVCSVGDAWIIDVGGRLMHYDGNNWTVVTTPIQDYLTSFYIIDASQIWFTSSRYVWFYNGNDWHSFRVGSSPIQSIYMLSSFEGWVATTYEIFHYIDGQWNLQTTVPRNLTILISKICMFSSNEGWAIGRGNSILHYKDGIWNLVALPNPFDGAWKPLVMPKDLK